MALTPQKTNIKEFCVRPATEEDAGLLLQMIRMLAEYEKRPEAATATEEDVRNWLFCKKAAEVLIAEYQGSPVGYALFYPVFASFACQGGIYIEDLLIYPALRGKGFGKEMMRQLALLAKGRGYNSIEWTVLDWNQPSIDFYHALGAKTKGGKVMMELEGEALEKL